LAIDESLDSARDKIIQTKIETSGHYNTPHLEYHPKPCTTWGAGFCVFSFAKASVFAKATPDKSENEAL